MSVDPGQVHALVVGIETYQFGKDLDGPAKDGLRFIDWLLAHGVLPKHIHFFVSPLAQNADVEFQSGERGLDVYPATRDAIDKFIRDELLVTYGQALYVFWGGHGVLTKTHQPTRQLLFADTTASNKLNLNIGSLAQALCTSKRGLGFGKQLFVIDACANKAFQGLYEAIQAESGGHEYSSMGETSQAEQVVMFACSEYGIAKNVSGAGVFSVAVMAELAGKSLFPEIQPLMDGVRDLLLKQGMPEPDYLWMKFGNQETISGQLGQAQNSGSATITNDRQTAPVKLGRAAQLEIKRLQTEIEDLELDYETVSAQLRNELSGSTQNKMKRQLKVISEELEERESKLSELRQDNG